MAGWSNENDNERLSVSDDGGKTNVSYTDKNTGETASWSGAVLNHDGAMGEAGLRAIRTLCEERCGPRAMRLLDATETVVNEMVFFPACNSLARHGHPRPGEMLMSLYDKMGRLCHQRLTDRGYTIADRGYVLENNFQRS